MSEHTRLWKTKAFVQQLEIVHVMWTDQKNRTKTNKGSVYRCVLWIETYTL